MMNIRQPEIRSHRSRGITLIEILIAVGILVILLSFAMPSVSSGAVRAEMKAAVENVEWSLHSARNLARQTESSVSVHIPQAHPDRRQTITYSTSEEGNRVRVSQLQQYTLPAGLVIVSDRESWKFDGRGLAKTPGQLLLASNKDESVKRTITFE